MGRFRHPSASFRARTFLSARVCFMFMFFRQYYSVIFPFFVWSSGGVCMVVSWTALIQGWPESATREAKFLSCSEKPASTPPTPNKFMLHPGAQPAGRSWHYSLAYGWRHICGCFSVAKSGNFSGDPPKIHKTTAELPPWRFLDISELPGVLRLRCVWHSRHEPQRQPDSTDLTSLSASPPFPPLDFVS